MTKYSKEFKEQGKLITLTKESLTSEIIESGMCSLQMNPTNGTIDTIKIFVWNSRDNPEFCVKSLRDLQNDV